MGFRRNRLYTRYCRKCKRYYQTEHKFGKMCEDCDTRYNKNQGKGRTITKFK